MVVSKKRSFLAVVCPLDLRIQQAQEFHFWKHKSCGVPPAFTFSTKLLERFAQHDKRQASLRRLQNMAADVPAGTPALCVAMSTSRCERSSIAAAPLGLLALLAGRGRDGSAPQSHSWYAL
jgi:hypothetical protein